MTEATSSTAVAVMGLGLMGTGMAERLIRAGFAVTVYNRNPDKAAPFEGRARIASSPRDAADGADVVIAMLADDRASRGVWLDEQGALAGLKSGAVCIDCSTLTPEWVRDWAAEVSESGGMPLDAPVTGSRAQAAAGELNFLVGGDAAVLERARPVLTAMSKQIIPLGPIGSGATFKLINNFLCGTQLVAMAEAMAWIDRSGLNRELAFETLLNGAPGSPMVKIVGTRMARQDYTPNFHLHLMAKDLAYASKEAEQSAGLILTTARTAQAALDAAVSTGYGQQDMSAVYRFIRGDSSA